MLLYVSSKNKSSNIMRIIKPLYITPYNILHTKHNIIVCTSVSLCCPLMCSTFDVDALRLVCTSNYKRYSISRRS